MVVKLVRLENDLFIQESRLFDSGLKVPISREQLDLVACCETKGMTKQEAMQMVERRGGKDALYWPLPAGTPEQPCEGTFFMVYVDNGKDKIEGDSQGLNVGNLPKYQLRLTSKQ